MTALPKALRIAFGLSALAVSMAVHGGEQLTVPAGARVSVILDETLSSKDNEKGDRFRGRLASNVVVGEIAVARRGDEISGRVLDARPAGRIFGRAGLSVALENVDVDGRLYRFESTPFELEGERSGDLKKIAVKAAIGGALGGAALAKRMAMTGTAVALITPGNQLALPHRAIVEFHLATPARLEGLSLPLDLDAAKVSASYDRVMWEMMRALQRHQWERRIEIHKEGELVFSEHARVWLDPNGNAVAQELPGSGEEKKFGIRGRRQKRTEEKMQALYGGLVELVRTYAFMPQDKRVSFVQNATWSPGFGGLAQSIQLEGVDVMNEHDWVVMWLDAATHAPRKMVVTAVLGQDMAQLDINFNQADDGTLYPSSMSMVIPTQDLTGTVRQTKMTRMR
jgi:hypothetical protein